MKLSRYVLIALIATSLFSCKKNDDNKDCTLSKASLVGTYKISAVKYKATASSSEIDFMSQFSTCDLDNLQTFKSDSTLITTDAGVKCDIAADDTSKWSLNGNTLTVDDDPSTITSFDCSGFTITQSGYEQDGDLITITFKKQ